MAGNTLGKLFCLTTFGESHGLAIGGIVDGCPPGLSLSEADIQPDLDRRAPAGSPFTSQRREPDQVKILSGVFEGKTTGTPIALFIENVDAKSHHYDEIKNKFRPGHADFTYLKKYGIRDYRGGGRASARETAVRVAAGAIAKKYLREQADTKIIGFVEQIGDIKAETKNFEAIHHNPFFFPDLSKVAELEACLIALRREGDSVGARVTVIAENPPLGLGEPVFDKLDAELASAMMGINAVKGVEIGAGFASVMQKGSEHRDEMNADGFLTNSAGGTLGGLSSGQALVLSMALKPTSSIRVPGKTINLDNDSTEIVTKGRHDPCVGIRAVPVAEAMMALVLMDHFLRHRAQNFDLLRS